MSVDQRLRRGLRASAETLHPTVADALQTVRQRARRARRATMVARSLVATLAMGLLAAGLPWSIGWVHGLGGEGHPTTAEPVQTNQLAGTYAVQVADSEAARRSALTGRWVIELRADGTVHMVAPTTFAGTTSGFTYRTEAQQMRTNAFASGGVCPVAEAADLVGTYRWERTGTTVRFAVVTETCEARRALVAGQPWEMIP
jgi:hypothetical protein